MARDRPEIGSEPRRRSSGASATRRCRTRQRSRRWSAASRRSATARAPELVWLLEHPPLYTAGTSARAEDLLDPARLPVYRSRPRRPVHLSRAGPAHRLCDARPGTGAAATCAATSGGSRSGSSPTLARLQRQGRAARRPGRRLGGRRRAAARTRSPRSACGCAAGSAITASR